MNTIHVTIICLMITAQFLIIGSMIEGYLKEILKKLEELEKK